MRIEQQRARGRRTMKRRQDEIRPRVSKPLKGLPDVETQVQEIVFAVCQALQAAPSVPLDNKRAQKNANIVVSLLMDQPTEVIKAEYITLDAAEEVRFQ